jgi:hypothetical protein
MAVDLTPRVIESTDSEYFERDTGRLKKTVIVTYRLGELGPFREEFDRETFSERELRERMQRKAEILKPFT